MRSDKGRDRDQSGSFAPLTATQAHLLEWATASHPRADVVGELAGLGLIDVQPGSKCIGDRHHVPCCCAVVVTAAGLRALDAHRSDESR